MQGKWCDGCELKIRHPTCSISAFICVTVAWLLTSDHCTYPGICRDTELGYLSPRGQARPGEEGYDLEADDGFGGSLRFDVATSCQFPLCEEYSVDCAGLMRFCTSAGLQSRTKGLLLLKLHAKHTRLVLTSA